MKSSADKNVSYMYDKGSHISGFETKAWLNNQQHGFPLRKYFIPGCVGRGLDLDLRIRPAPPAPAPAPPAASGNPSGWAQAGPKWVGPGYTDLAPLGLRSKNKVFERPG